MRAAKERRPKSDVTAEDWLAVANRTLADGDDGANGSPLFAALCRAVDYRNAQEMRATMAEEVAADLERARDRHVAERDGAERAVDAAVVRAQQNEVRAIEAERKNGELILAARRAWSKLDNVWLRNVPERQRERVRAALAELDEALLDEHTRKEPT
jgi:hypothetical protein